MRGGPPRLHGKVLESDYDGTKPPSGRTEVFVKLRVETDFALDDSEEVFFNDNSYG